MKSTVNLLPTTLENSNYDIFLYNPDISVSGMRDTLTVEQKQTFDNFVNIPEFGDCFACNIDNAPEQAQFDIEADKTIVMYSIDELDYNNFSQESKDKYTAFVTMMKSLAEEES